jgi:hypothetical protein
MNSFENRLNIFLDFCSADEIFSVVHHQLITVADVDFDQWFSEIQSTISSMAGSGNLIFPTDLEQRLSIMYQLLHYVRGGNIDYISFSVDFFALGTGKITAYVRAFNEAITTPLVRELGYRLEDMLNSLPENTSSTVPPSMIQIIHKAQNVIQQTATGTNIAQTVNFSVNSEIEELFEKLKVTVHESVASSERQECLEIVEAAKEEATSQNPKLSVLKVLFSSLPSINSVLSITVSIMRLLGHG